MPPHLHGLPKPLHETDKSKVKKALLYATVIAGAFGFTLALLNFPLNVVIPSSAPVWAGLSSVLK